MCPRFPSAPTDRIPHCRGPLSGRADRARAARPARAVRIVWADFSGAGCRGRCASAMAAVFEHQSHYCGRHLGARQDGALVSDRIAGHMPDFARHGKGDIARASRRHRAGYPSQAVSSKAWTDHAQMCREVCDFTLESGTPGSRLHYHPKSAFWTAAALIETVTKRDYRDFLRQRIIEPLGLSGDVFIGMPDAEHSRVATIYEPRADGAQQPLADENTAPYRRAGIPSSGGFATARGMARALPDDAAWRKPERYSSFFAPADRIRDPQSHGRHGRRRHGNAHASRARRARARHDGDDTRTGNARVAAYFRARRRGLIVLLGRSRLRRFIRLSHEQPHTGSMAQRPAGPRRQPGALGDRLRPRSCASSDGGRVQ